MEFFRDTERKAALRRLLSHVDGLKPKSGLFDFYPQLARLINTFINNPEEFDKNCLINIEWIGQSFTSYINNAWSRNDEDQYVQLAEIFSMSYRFLCEFEFSQPKDLSMELSVIKTYVTDNMSSFPSQIQSQLLYANYVMPVNVTKRLINDPRILEFRSFSDRVAEAEKLRVKLDSDISEKNEEIAQMKKGLEQIKTAYNFVGLVKAFEDLGGNTKKDIRKAFWGLIALAVLMVLPLSLEVVFVISGFDSVEKHWQTLVYVVAPLIGVELVLLYFFRIVLHHHKGLVAQQLQLNLRIALCQFIQSYSSYAAEIKTKDAGALEKFENLIFSGIVSNPDALPSTFDGVEQISKLVATVRSR